jgi:PAS domain-containing protein
LDLYYSPVADDNGKPAGVMAMVVDTTERVISERRRQAAEDAYRADNERVRLALNAGALLGSFVWDVKSNVLSGDERFARTFSYPAEQPLDNLPQDIAEAHIHRTTSVGCRNRSGNRWRRANPSMPNIGSSALMAVICGYSPVAVASSMNRASRFVSRGVDRHS